MKLHLPTLLRAALLACLAFPSTLWATSYLAEGVNKDNVMASDRFYDGGKGYYWGLPGAMPVADPFVANASMYLYDDSGHCWAYTTANAIQYWQTYYGVFSDKADELPYGHTYAKRYFETTGGTQSLEVNMAYYHNWLDEGGTMYAALPWYMGGEVLYSELMRPGYSSVGYFSSYFDRMSGGTIIRDNPYMETEFIDASSPKSSFDDAVTRLLGYTRKADGSYELTNKGQLLYLGMTGFDYVTSGGHAITCYGFDTDEAGNVTALWVVNSDDCSYEIFKLYVKRINVGYALYTDAACQKLWRYAGMAWYIDEISTIKTPEVLQDMLAEYSDTSKPLYWNGGTREWGGKAGVATTEELPTKATGWEAVAGTGTTHAGFYASYYDGARPVVFDDRAESSGTAISLASHVTTPSMSVANSAVSYSINGAGYSLTATSLSKTGSADIHFSNVALNASQTTISQGRLELGKGAVLTGATVELSAVSGSTAALCFSGGSATLTGALTVGSGSILDVTAGTVITATDVHFADGSTLSMTLGRAGGDTPLLSLTGNLMLGNKSTIDLTLSSALTGDSVVYTLASATGALDLNLANNCIVSGSGYETSGYSADLQISEDGKSIQVVFVNVPSLYWEGGDGTWNKTDAVWSNKDDEAGSLTYEDGSYARFTNGSATVSVGEAVTAGILQVSNGTYELENAGNLTVEKRIVIVDQGHLAVDTAPVLGSGGAILIDRGSDFTVKSGDMTLHTLNSEGTVTLEGGSLSMVGEVGSGGTVNVSDTLSLAEATDNVFTNITAKTLALSAGSTVDVTGSLEVQNISLASLSDTESVTVGSLASSSIDFTLADDAKEALAAMGLKSSVSVTLLSAGSSTAGQAGPSIEGGDSININDYDYFISKEGSSIVLTAYRAGVVQWDNNEWASIDAANAQNDVSAGFLGKGSENVALGSDRVVGSLLVEAGNGKEYTTSGAGSLKAATLDVTAGAMTFGHTGGTELTGAVTVAEQGKLSVAEGSRLDAANMVLLADGAFSNAGTTVLSGALDAGEYAVENTGFLSVGSGTEIGRLTGSGDVAVTGDGEAAIASLQGLNNLSIASDATLWLGTAATVTGDFTGGGRLISSSSVYMERTVTQGSIAATQVILTGQGNQLTELETVHLGLTGDLAPATPLLTVTTLTVPTVPGARSLKSADDADSLTLSLSDTDAAYGSYELITAANGMQEAQFTLSAETLLAFRKNRAGATLTVQGNTLFINLEYSEDSIYAVACTTPNGQGGGRLLDAAFYAPNVAAPGTDLAAVLTALEAPLLAGDTATVDRVASAVAGASIPALGSAYAGDVSRQLRAIRNRVSFMGVDPAVYHHDLPYVNAWINAEGDYRKLDSDGTAAGYTLDSWGGTVGLDVDVTDRLTLGIACSALYGNFSASGADIAEGDMDTRYATAFGRYLSRRWVHTFVATAGAADISLDRTVNYGAGSYTTNGSADGSAWGLLYELAYTIQISEDETTCLQPIANVSFVHASINSYTESGSDAALSVAKQENNLVSFGLGARMQTIVGENIYNRSSVLELRALAKADAGDREGEADVSFAALPGTTASMKAADYGSVGVELGAGLAIPVMGYTGELFVDVSADLRSGYSEVNGAIGLRAHF